VGKRKELFSNLLVMCASLIAITGILEIALRIRSPEDIKSARRAERRATGESCDALFAHDKTRGWRLVPNCTVTSAETRNREYTITIHSNNHGFRDYHDYRFGKSEGTVRVVVLGDSFGYGNGVEELGRYSNLLDNLLGENVEVYNLAISNYGLDQALLTLQSEGLRYDPDMIIVGFSDPMFERLSRKATGSLVSKPFFELDKGVLELRSQPSEKLLAVESLLNKSYLWLFVTRRVSEILSTLRSRDDTAKNAALAERIIGRFLEISRRTKSSLVFFTINPTYTLKREWATMPDVNRLLERASGSSGLHFLDLYPVFRSSNYAALFYPIDGHFNVDGHILVAEQLCKFVQARDILPEKAIASSCDVDEAAVYQSIEVFRRCSLNNTSRALFSRGKCIPRQ
jgi:hypothetical protein